MSALINIYARVPEGFIIKSTSDFRKGDSFTTKFYEFLMKIMNQPKFTQTHHKTAQSCWLTRFQITALSYLLKNHASVSISDAVGTRPPPWVVSVAWLIKKSHYGISCSPTWKSQTSFWEHWFLKLRLLVSVFLCTVLKQKVSAPLLLKISFLRWKKQLKYCPEGKTMYFVRSLNCSSWRLLLSLTSVPCMKIFKYRSTVLQCLFYLRN